MSVKWTDWHRFELAKIYQSQIMRFGLEKWKKYKDKIIPAAHKRVIK